MTQWTDDLVDSAMCLWEAMLDLKSGDTFEEITQAFAQNGFASMRNFARSWAEQCHLDWQAADFDDCFDWEWCPLWLREGIDWSEPHRPTMKHR
jgi:hypothetical protein